MYIAEIDRKVNYKLLPLHHLRLKSLFLNDQQEAEAREAIYREQQREEKRIH